MNNSNYHSLSEKLIQSGIIQIEDKPSDTIQQNPFEAPVEKVVASLEQNNEINIPKALQKKQKRLNQSDYEMVSQGIDETINIKPFKVIARFLNFKENLASKGALGMFENFLFAFFPKLYKAKLARDAMIKLKELNIDTTRLLDKTIPYGEGEIRYQNLIKYLSYANEIQTKIKKNTI